jgi:hypothetical protein
MKELQSAACNITALPLEEGGFSPLIECILIVSEPKYTLDEAGHQVKSRLMEMLRFNTSAKGLRSMAEMFGKWADEADDRISTAMADAVKEAAKTDTRPEP